MLNSMGSMLAEPGGGGPRGAGPGARGRGGTGERLRVAVDVNEGGDRRQGSRRLDSFQLILPWDVELDGVDAGGAGGGVAGGRGPGNRVPEMPGEGAAAALRQRRRAGRR